MCLVELTVNSFIRVSLRRLLFREAILRNSCTSNIQRTVDPIHIQCTSSHNIVKFVARLTLHLHTGCMWNESEVLKEPSLDLVEVVECVLIGHVGGADVKLEVRSKVLKVVIVGQL